MGNVKYYAFQKGAKKMSEKRFRNPKARMCLEVLHNALLEDRDNMMIWVETDKRLYEVEDIRFEQFLDQNERVCTVINIRTEHDGENV